jgi:hypothetical protein
MDSNQLAHYFTEWLTLAAVALPAILVAISEIEELRK